MHRRSILWAAASAFGAAFAASSANAATEAPRTKKLKVVYHLNDLDKVSFVLGNAHSLMRYMGRLKSYLDAVHEGGPRERLDDMRRELRIDRILGDLDPLMAGTIEVRGLASDTTALPAALRLVISWALTSGSSCGSTRPTASIAIRRAFFAVAFASLRGLDRI